ncbi:MAG: serine/threonine protein kinase [Pirellulaceae bacterium]|nr:serine/threonine protein kinase [Pirellulaceae bacterium]
MNASRIGPFALEEKLGGPQSSVYRAIHLQQRRQVALKVFSIPLAANQLVRNEFSDEMALLKRLQVPQVVKCFGGSLEKTHGYLALEIVEGETLAEVVSHRTRLASEQVVDFAEQITTALQAAHELELTHHDLVPGKILVTPDERIKVLDFRRDRAKNPFCHASQKRTKDRLAFQAPEQIRGDGAGPKADLYALGCLLFYMLTGRPPFEGSAEEIAHKQQSEVPPRVSTLVLDCSIWLDPLVAQLLEKESARRPYSAGAVLLALQETRKRDAAGGGVTQHALGGLSSLKMDVNKDEVRRLVGRKAAAAAGHETARNETPIYERPWVIATALSLALASVLSVLTWSLWPMSPDKMIAEADRLMASDDPTQQREAEHSYLRPLVARYPGTEFASRAQEHLEVIDMNLAENRVKKLHKLGREPNIEAARLYLEASKFEEFGDRVTALDKYQSIVDLIKPEGDDRLYVLLARREAGRLKSDKSTVADERGKFIDQKLAQAEQLQKDGKVLEARKILTGIVALYGDNAEYATFVSKVQKRLDELK